MNRAFLRAEAYREANEIWSVGKLIGVDARYGEEEIIKNLVATEVRDRFKGKNVHEAGAEVVS